MRTLRLIGWVAAISACGGGGASRTATTPRANEARIAPVRLRLVLAPGQVLVYRREDAPEDAPEIHWVAQRERGALVLGVDDPEAQAGGRAEMPADLVLPLSDRPIGRDVVRVQRSAEAGGLHLRVDEELQVVGVAAGMVRVRFRRRTAIVERDGARAAPYLEQSGEATWEPVAGRFSRVSFTETRDEAFGGGSGSAVWVYDPTLSRERTAGRDRSRSAAADLDAWIAEHDATAEVNEVVAALAQPDGSAPALAFQVRAHPTALWTAVLEHPEAAARFAQDERVVAGFVAGPPDEVVTLLRAHWAEAAFAYPLVARTADERLRPELRRLAATRGAVATEARLTLQALDLAAQPRIEAWRPFARYPARLEAVWARLSARGIDPSPLVPVMLALASSPGVPAQVGAVCTEVSRAAGFPDSGDDRRALRQWWASEGAKSWGERLGAAARSSSSERRVAALALLAHVPDPAAREPLVAAIDDEATRWPAAVALASLHDDRGAPALVAALDDPRTAADALAALGGLGDTTLGLDPTATPDDPDRASALSRWREWLRQRRAR